MATASSGGGGGIKSEAVCVLLFLVRRVKDEAVKVVRVRGVVVLRFPREMLEFLVVVHLKDLRGLLLLHFHRVL